MATTPTLSPNVPDQGLPWAPIPAQYKNDLINLANGGQLSGVPPQVLSWIMEAESGPSYEGGGYNGFAGGWFGLAGGSTYPAGSSPVSLLKNASDASFQTQAVIAASAYGSYLKTTNGDWVAAENIYQTGKASGSANGAGIFSGFLKGVQNVTNPDAGGVVPASPTPIPLGNNGVNVGAGVFSGLSGLETGVDAILGDITSASWWKRVGLFSLGTVLVIGGIILFVSTTKTGQRVESDAAVAAVA